MNNGQRLDKLKNARIEKHRIEVFEDGSIAEIKESEIMRVEVESGDLGKPTKSVDVGAELKRELPKRKLENQGYDLSTGTLVNKKDLKKPPIS